MLGRTTLTRTPSGPRSPARARDMASIAPLRAGDHGRPDVDDGATAVVQVGEGGANRDRARRHSCEASVRRSPSASSSIWPWTSRPALSTSASIPPYRSTAFWNIVSTWLVSVTSASTNEMAPVESDSSSRQGLERVTTPGGRGHPGTAGHQVAGDVGPLPLLAPVSTTDILSTDLFFIRCAVRTIEPPARPREIS